MKNLTYILLLTRKKRLSADQKNDLLNYVHKAIICIAGKKRISKINAADLIFYSSAKQALSRISKKNLKMVAKEILEDTKFLKKYDDTR